MYRLRTIFNEILNLLHHWRWCSWRHPYLSLYLLAPFLDTARMEGWMEHWDVMKVFAIYCHSQGVPGPHLAHIGHTGHWCQLYKVLDHQHQIRSLYLQLLLQWLQSFFTHGHWLPANLPNWSESSNAHRWCCSRGNYESGSLTFGHNGHKGHTQWS